jgi:hypothetical protein
MQKSLVGPLHVRPMNFSARWLAGYRRALAVGALILGAGAILASGLPASLWVTELAPTEACDVGKQVCTVALPNGGSVALDLAPRPISASRPLQLQVAAVGFSARQVAVSMVGVSMNMIETRTDLAPSGEASWRGDLSLPACSSGPMAWQANVDIRGWWRTYIVPFRFQSGSH